MKKSEIEKLLKSDISAAAPSDFDEVRAKCGIFEDCRERQPAVSPVKVSATSSGNGVGSSLFPGRIVACLLAALFLIAALSVIFYSLLNGGNTDVVQGGYFLLDINPSLEIDYDEKGCVEEVRGLNEDGEVLLFGLNLAGKTYKDAVDEIFSRCVQLGYFSAERTDNAVLVSATNTDGSKDEVKTQDIKDILLNGFANGKIRGVVITGVDNPALADAAAQYGIDTQKYELIQTYIGLGGVLSEEEYSKIPIRDLYKGISELTKSAKKEAISELEKAENKMQEELFEAVSDVIERTIKELERGIERLDKYYDDVDKGYYEELYNSRIDKLQDKADKIEDAKDSGECRSYVSEILDMLKEMAYGERDGQLKALLNTAYWQIYGMYKQLENLDDQLISLSASAEALNAARTEKFGDTVGGEDFDIQAWQEEYEQEFASSWYELKASWEEDRKHDLD